MRSAQGSLRYRQMCRISVEAGPIHPRSAISVSKSPSAASISASTIVMSLEWLGEMNKKRGASGGIGQAVDLACVVATRSPDALINGHSFASAAERWPLMRVEPITTESHRHISLQRIDYSTIHADRGTGRGGRLRGCEIDHHVCNLFNARGATDDRTRPVGRHEIGSDFAH